MCPDLCCRERAKAHRRQTRLAVTIFLVLAAVLMFGPALVPDAEPERVVVVDRVHAEDAADHDWRVNKATFYGPGFYGRRTACGQTMRPESQWVAVSQSQRRQFPCGTLVRFEWQGRELVVPVNDVCPGCKGNHLWDLSAGACHYLSQGTKPRCNSGSIAWTR